MRLSVVVVNYRTPQLVEGCLETLAAEMQTTSDCGVVVVDNGSPDDSAEQIAQIIARRDWGDWARLVRSSKNGGFAAGNNVGIRAQSADFYLLLNSDALIRPGVLAGLLDAAAAYPRAGLIGPRLEWPNGTPQVSSFRDHSPLGELVLGAETGPVTRLLGRWSVPLPPSNEAQSCDWVSFACVLIRDEVLRRVGPLDEGYFMYFEDADYCRKARRAGFEVVRWPDCRVVHLRGGTSPVKALTRQRKPRPAYYYSSRSRYLATFYGRPGLWAANLLWLAGRTISFSREALGRKEPHTCEGEAFDIWTDAWRPFAH